MNFPTAVATVFRRYAVFTGRAGRPEFWWFFLFGVVASIVAETLDATLFSSLLDNPDSGFDAGGGPLTLLLVVVTIVPMLAVGVRRLHDTNRSGWWLFVWLIPVIGWIWALWLLAKEGDTGDNQYGPPVPSTELSVG